MDILQVIFILALIGLFLWAVLTYVPMAAPFPTIITVVTVLVTVLWLLRVFNVMGMRSGIVVP